MSKRFVRARALKMKKVFLIGVVTAVVAAQIAKSSDDEAEPT